jgi:hypothetical protein
MYSEAQRLASLRYRQKMREIINQKERLRYAKMKEQDPEKYHQRVERCAESSCVRSKIKTDYNKQVKEIMCISI